MQPKLLYFLSHPIQYISPLLRELAKEVDLEVYYYSDLTLKEGALDKGFGREIKWDTPLMDGYKNFILKNYSSSVSMNCRFGDAINFGVLSVLRRSKCRVVLVNSWSYATDLIIILTAWFFGKKVWLRAENPLNQELLKTGWKQTLKLYFLRFIIFKLFIDRFLYIGIENKNFFEYLGVDHSKLLYTPYCVDNKKFSNEFEYLQFDKISLKHKYGIPRDNKVVLFCGKYIDKKRPLDLLKAHDLLNMKGITFVFVGDGPLRPEMERFILDRKLEGVILTGFINQSIISEYYSISNIFVMCSGLGETWGLAVNEAMNFGLPIIVSDITGCSSDLVRGNGLIFETGNISELGNCIMKLLENENLSASFGLQSSKLIKSYSIENIVENIRLSL